MKKLEINIIKNFKVFELIETFYLKIINLVCEISIFLNPINYKAKFLIF